MTATLRRLSSVGIALILGLALASCGGSSKHAASVTTSVSETGPAPPGSVVVQVGKTPISGAVYNHWIAIGDATVNAPVPGRPAPKPIAYEPPSFAACIANLEASVPKPHGSTAQLKSKCRQTYTGIQARILNFLITGYWLREEAAEQGASVSEAEVRKKFEAEKRAQYPTAASFRKLQEASRQTVPDLMFAVERQLLSAKLLKSFTNAHSHEKSEQATITAFNASLRSKWTPRTSCQPGYVVKDCRQRK
jgi:hypothetical protein